MPFYKVFKKDQVMQAGNRQWTPHFWYKSNKEQCNINFD